MEDHTRQKQVVWHYCGYYRPPLDAIRLVCWVNLGFGYLTPNVDWSTAVASDMWEIGQEFFFKSMEG